MEIFLVCRGEWEDLIVFVSRETALEYSKKHPRAIIQIFAGDECMVPTYTYYQNGIIVDSMKAETC